MGMRYVIQNRIYTLIDFGIYNEERLSSFTRADIQFSPWDGGLFFVGRSNFWIAESEREAPDINEAWNSFNKDLTQVTSRIAFVGQAYLQTYQQPYLIKTANDRRVLFQYTRDRGSVPLMFMENELSGLYSLLQETAVPNEFYLYWNDATNTVGYSSKLVLMFAALEALFRKDRRVSKKAYYDKIDSVFGHELREELYGTQEDKGRSGLRHRLSHGEYWGGQAAVRNYVEAIHKGIIRHFNSQVLGKSPLHENVISPQRHPFGNIEKWKGYVRSESEAPLNLKDLVNAFDKDFNNPPGIEIVQFEDHP